MLSSIQIGPLMLAAERALALLLIGAFMVVAGIIARKMDRAADRASLWALGVGIVAARAGFVANNWQVFAAHPASILAVWQGGFSLAAGVVGALAPILLVMRLKRPGIALASSVVVLCAAFLVGANMMRPVPQPLPNGVALERWSGEQVKFAELRGRPFVINLWASWCLPCRREMPMLVDASSRSQVPILLVNSGEERAAAQQFLRDNRLPANSVYLDPAAALAAAVGANGYPATLFVNSAGQIETMYLGEISRAILSNELRALEPGAPRPVPMN